MPIFQDYSEEEPPLPDETGVFPRPMPIHSSGSSILRSRQSEESIRTELCEGPISDSPGTETLERATLSAAISDRAELIERLKRGESPTWVPNRHLESLFHQNRARTPPQSQRSPSRKSSPGLLPAPTITPEKKGGPAEEVSEAEALLQQGLNIERPRSALHSGDFTQSELSHASDNTEHPDKAHDATCYQPSREPWLATSPPRHYVPFALETRTPFSARLPEPQSLPSSLSSSVSSSFVYKPPTSPLVQSESNDDLVLSLPGGHIDMSGYPAIAGNPRRHTLASRGYPPSSLYSTGYRNPAPRRDGSYPYQAHQPRRSLTSSPSVPFLGSSPQPSGLLGSRRPSLSSDSSPIQHASMVGSYEESILRGRMSTTPSKPLDFLAQIGVLGLGKCKPSLRCPAHVTLPFSAVFYSYASTSHGRSKNDDGPSPYVGQVDLENGLPNAEEEVRSRRKARGRHSEWLRENDTMDMVDPDRLRDSTDAEVRRTMKQKRRSNSPRAPPGGAYRIPEKGQIQIIIKNQNKTAVKLFLVPYDLIGMEPGTKTFIRQRSYSAGPIIDTVPGLKDTGTGERPILRYLVHLHICSPSRGRFYLYKSIRVVFANRVPDGKEKLQNEITLPEPRFTPYKPIRVMCPPLSQASGPGAMLAAEKAFRRRSSGFSFGGQTGAAAFSPADSMPPSLPQTLSNLNASSAGLGLFSGTNLPVDPIPFRLPRNRLPGAPGEDDVDEPKGSNAAPAALLHFRTSSSSTQTSRPTTQDSVSEGPHVWGDDDRSDAARRYDKLSKGDAGYGGNLFFAQGANGSPGSAEGLLSKRLRSLGVEGGNHGARPVSSEEDKVGEQ